MPEHVISNTSPLFYLHRLRQLDLLRELPKRRLQLRSIHHAARCTGRASLFGKAYLGVNGMG
jgi:hypothetical protein